jgi:hypothetical protein
LATTLKDWRQRSGRRCAARATSKARIPDRGAVFIALTVRHECRRRVGEHGSRVGRRPFAALRACGA